MMKFRERFMMGEVPFDDIFSLTDKWNFEMSKPQRVQRKATPEIPTVKIAERNFLQEKQLEKQTTLGILERY